MTLYLASSSLAIGFRFFVTLTSSSRPSPKFSLSSSALRLAERGLKAASSSRRPFTGLSAKRSSSSDQSELRRASTVFAVRGSAAIMVN